MENPKTPHFHDVGIFGCVHGSQNQYCVSLETPGYIKKPNKDTKSFSKYLLFMNLKISEIIFWKFRTRRGPNIPAIRLINSWKAWIWDQSLSESMKWIFGNMESLKLWKQETKKPRPHETNEPRSQQTNQLFYFHLRESPTPQHTDSPPPHAPAPLLGDTRELGGHEGTSMDNSVKKHLTTSKPLLWLRRFP